jgi:hypothetical protein
MTEPFWVWWQEMTEPVRISTGDLLAPVLTEQTSRPVRRWARYRGLDRFKSESRSGLPGILWRNIPPHAPQRR